MTVVSNDRRKTYSGNDVTTTFTGPKAELASHISVWLIDDATGVSSLVSTGAYSLSGVGGRRQTTVLMATPPASGKTLLILRTVPFEQDVDISNQGAYLPEVVELAMDNIVRQTQQLADLLNTCFRFPETLPDFDGTIQGPYTPGSPLLIGSDGKSVAVGDYVGSGDLLLRGDLASASSGKGAALVSYKSPASGSVPRSVADRLADGGDYVEDFGWTASKTGPETIYDALVAGAQFAIPRQIITLAEVGARWAVGEKYPIAFFGDSTTDGRVSTTDGTNEATVYNFNYLSAGAVPDGYSRDHDESDVPNAYTSVLQRMCRAFYGQSILRVYNAGYRSQRLDTGWAGDNVHNALYANPAYSDAKWVGILFGLNDSNYASGSDLATNTYYRTKALILDAYARGVQPALITCTPTAEIVDGSDYGSAVEVANVIDNVKRRLAVEFGIELIEFGAGLWKWLRENGDGTSSDGIILDSLHMGDAGHLKQAEYLLAKHIAPASVATITGPCDIDGSMPETHFSRTSTALSTGSSSRGVTDPRRFVRLTETGYNTVESSASQAVYDLWVYVEAPSLSLVYVHTAVPQAAPSSATTRAKLPKLSAIAGDFSATNQKTTYFNDTLPGLVGGAPHSVLFQQNFRLGKLKWGLNRVRITIPTGSSAELASWYSFPAPGSLTGPLFGHFDFVDQHADARPAMSNYTNGPNQQNRGVWRDLNAINGPICLASEAPTTGNFQRYAPGKDANHANVYGLRSVGDSVQWQFKVPSWPNGFGLILSSNCKDSYGLSLLSPFDISKDYVMASSFVIYASSDTLRYYAHDETEAGVLTVVDSAIARANFENKLLRVTLQLDAANSMSITITNAESNTQLYTASITDADFINEFCAGIAGGAWNNRSIATSGFIGPTVFQMRERRA